MTSWKTCLGALTVLFVIVGVCVKENPVDCPDEGYALVFYYPGNGTADIFPEEIDHVELYVYNIEGERVSLYGLKREELELFQGAKLDLPPGNYTVVGWGNIDGYSQITANNPLSDGRIYQRQFLEGESIGNFDSLYFGRRGIKIDERGSKTDTLDFISAHIDMEVHIEGYEGRISTRAEGQGIIQVQNISVGYDFAMNVTGEKSVMYPMWRNNEENTEIYSAFNLLRFDNENDIVINIRDSDEGDIVGTVIVSEFLKQYGINVEGVNEITIPVFIFFDEFGMRVSVEPWDTAPVNPVPRP